MRITTVALLCLLILGVADSKSQDLAPDDGFAERAKQYLEELGDHNMSGVALVEYRGDIILHAPFGLADRAKDLMATRATIYDIGSITKQFTAAAILTLEMEEALSVGDRISKYFANVPADKSEITIHHLLTHASGFPPAIGDDYEEIERSDFVNLALRTELMHEPGAEYVYSNVGYSLLAAIVEQLTGKSYEQALRERLFDPAGMASTGYTMIDDSKVAVGYRDDGIWGKPNEKAWATDGPFWHLRGNGGILSTAEDMLAWHRALLSDDILDATAKKKMYTRHIEEGEDVGTFYGYGWALFPTPRNTTLVTHNGGNGIFFADFWRYLEEGLTIYISTSTSNEVSERMAEELIRMIIDESHVPAAEPPQAMELDQFPESDEGRAARGAVAALTGSTQEVLASLVEDLFAEGLKAAVPMEQHLEILGQMQRRLRGASMETIRVRDSEYEIQLSAKTGESVFLLVEIEQASGKIAGLGIDEDD